MKINISRKETITNYLNLNPLNGDQIFNLDYVCDANECDEIQARDITSLIPYHKLQSTIEHYTSKIRHGGLIILGGIDGRNIAQLFNQGLLSLKEFNEIVYGTQESPWHFNQSATTVFEVSDILRDLGFKVEYRNVFNCYFIVQARRQ